jgi:DNA-binding transcriptional ArsR family regulator
MKEGPDIARVAALIGDPARANMLTALMAGKMLTAGELAREAGVTLPTASSHLSKLELGGLVAPRKQGRHKYFSLSSVDVASVLEALMGLAAGKGHLRTRTGPRDENLRRARVCYNHLAGDMGIQLFESFRRRGFTHGVGEAIDLSDRGHAFLVEIGIDVHALGRGRTRLCRECLDWSARRPHLAGSVGRALLTHFEAGGWARRERETRAVRFTREGEARFHDLFPAE